MPVLGPATSMHETFVPVGTEAGAPPMTFRGIQLEVPGLGARVATRDIKRIETFVPVGTEAGARSM